VAEFAPFWDDPVGTGLGPGAGVPGAAQPPAGFLAGVVGAPGGFVPVDVPGNLGGASTEGAGEPGQLDNLAGLVEVVAAGGERSYERPGRT
jgi:hypothetical protein